MLKENAGTSTKKIGMTGRAVNAMPAKKSELADPQRAARLVLRRRADMLPGSRPAIAEAEVIVRSQRRVTQRGLNRTRGSGMRALSFEQLETRRREFGLAEFIPWLRQVLDGGDNSQIITVHDPAGWVLWRFGGSPTARRNSDALGLIEGACWGENTVGTNAAGAALVERQGLLCIGCEHYAISHYPFACAATPLYDPWGHRLLGALNATTLVQMVHPNTLPMLKLAATLVSEWGRKTHDDKLDPLRDAAWKILPRLGTPAVVTDGCGHVAISQQISSKLRVLPLPTPISDQPFNYPKLGGSWIIEPFRNGWLWRPSDQEPLQATRVELDVSQPDRWSLTVHWTHVSTQYYLTSKKYVEILFLLAEARQGLHAAELSRDLYGNPRQAPTVRSHFSKMQKELGVELFRSDPYRFMDHLDVTLNRPVDLADLLPFSTAPAVCRIRTEVDTTQLQE